MYLVRTILVCQDYRYIYSCADAIYFGGWSHVSSMPTFTIIVLVSTYSYNILEF